jgi:cobalt-zinc-cadmium efflux system outer membrane protein
MTMHKMFIFILFCLLLSSVSGLAQTPPAPLTLQQVVDTYIQNNLELQAARYKLERTKADQIAGRLRPNPTITVIAENLAVSGPTPFSRLYEVGATYTATIELGGKRALRERTADAVVSAAEVQFEDTMRRGVAEVKRLYLEAMLASYDVQIATENRQTFEELVRFNQTRFQEGAIPEVELIKVRLERVKVESTIKQAQVASRQAIIRLFEKLAITDVSSRTVIGELSARTVNLDRNAFRQFALNERADVRAAMADVNAANQRLALEKARAKKDISPFAGYKRIGNDNTLLAGVNIPLKFRDHNQAEIARADADVRTAQTRLQLVRNRALAEVEAAFEGLQASRELVDMFEMELLQQADESRTITLAAYEEGGTELLPVLEAQRTRSEVRQEYFKTLFDYQAGIVALELAVGREIQP